MKGFLMEDYIEKEVAIAEIETLLENGYDVEVDSPDGYVSVNFFVNKGMFEEYILRDDLTGNELVRCNAGHLFQTTVGWVPASQLANTNNISIHILMDDGSYKPCSVVKTGDTISIVDINVDHPNHRYYTNGVSSHNTGVGKSLFMCHFAAANLLAGKNVLYITMEMAEERIAQRIDANLLNIPIAELEGFPKKIYEDKINRLRLKTGGKLIVKEYPTAAAGSGHFRHLLNELHLKKNFRPDIIYIDYLNICSSARLKFGANVNSYSYIKAIAEELRGLAVEKNLPIVSATQINRTGSTNTDPGLEDTSESFGLPATVDFMCALISTEEMENLGQIMIKQLKNRYNDITAYKRFVVGIDRAKMRLFNTEQSAQDDIMQDKPVMDNTTYGERSKEEDQMKWMTKTAGTRDFSGLFSN